MNKIVPKTANIDKWELKFKELKEYFENNNTFYISLSDADHYKLLVWVQSQISNYRKNILNPQRIEKLNSIGFSFDLKYYSKRRTKAKGKLST